MAEAETIDYDDGVQEEQQTWYLTKPVQQSTTAPAAHCTVAALHDKLYWAVLLLIVLACGHFTAVDKGGTQNPISSTAKLVSSFSSSSQQRLSLHSTIVNVDMKTGLMELELLVVQPLETESSICSSGGAVRHELVLGSTSHGAAQLVVPLCEAAVKQEPIIVMLPLIKQAAPHPFDEHTVDIKVGLRQVAAGGSQAMATAPAVIANAAAVELVWSAVWAVQDLQVAVERKMSAHAKLLSAVAGTHSALVDQLGTSLKLQRQAEVVYSIRFLRSSWLRIIHLTAALLQVVAVGWCCMLLMGHCLCVYLMQRFICSSVHSAYMT